MTRRRVRMGIVGGAIVVALVLLRTGLVLPKSTPFGIIALGVVLGSLNSLLAIGLVLVYRSSRIVNFAQGELGASAAVLAVELSARGWNYFLAVGTGLATAIVASGVIEVTIVRRFRSAPRLILTVATIALANLLVFVELIIPRVFGHEVVAGGFTTPLSRFHITIRPVIFSGDHILVIGVAAAAIVALRAFFASRYGVAVRAAAENSDRAALSGIPTKSLQTMVWIIAGLLSAAAAILQGPVVGLQVGVLIGPGLLLRALTAAVVGRMESMTVTVAAAIGLGIVEQALFWSYGRSATIDVILLAIILAGLLIQRRRLLRIDPSESSAWESLGEVRPTPDELASTPEVRYGRIALLVVLAGLAIGVPIALSPSRQNLMAVLVIFGLIGVSLLVLTGWAGQISLGQMAIVGIGGAVAGSLSADHGWDFVVTLVAAALAGALAAGVLGLPALRIRGLFLAVTTLGFAVVTSNFLLRQGWLTPGGSVARPVLFERFDLESDLTYYYVCLTLLVVVILAVRNLRSSRMGRAIIGTRDNERAAQSYGVNAMYAKLAAFAISGAVAGLAGGLLVYQQHGLPATQYSPQQSLSVFLIAMIGGLGSIVGALLGALYVKGSQYLLQGTWSFLASGAGVLVLLLILPSGLGSLVFRLRDVLLARIADRHGVEVPSLVADRRVAEEEPDLEPLGVG